MRYSHPFQLPLQTGLSHRGRFGLAEGPRFPPAGAFEAIGGRDAVVRLVDGLYDRIETDCVLRPAFRQDLSGEREKLKEFFEVWFQGEPNAVFDAESGHELKRTHERLSISRGMAHRWVGHFFKSFAEAVQDPDIANEIRPLIMRHAMALVNRPGEPVPGERLRSSCSGVEMQRFTRLVHRDDAEGISAAATARARATVPFGSTLLLIAAVRGKARAAEELLRQGVDVNEPAMLSGSEASLHGLPTLRITPLCGALARGRAEVVKLLVEHGAQYDIFTASCIGNVDAVREMLDLAPELAESLDPACDLPRITPLMHAVFAGQLETARLLLNRGATVGLNSSKLIEAAANRGDKALTDLLFEHGADATSLGAGAWVMYPAIAGKLLARGANVNRWPPWIGLCCTGNSGHKENAALARAMLRCGADVTAIYNGRTALHCAAKAGFASVVEALIEHGTDVNALNEFGQTPLDDVENAGKSIDKEPVRRMLIAHGGRHRAGLDY